MLYRVQEVYLRISINQANTYQHGGEQWNLGLMKKDARFNSNNELFVQNSLLNNRTELISKCWYKNKAKLQKI